MTFEQIVQDTERHIRAYIAGLGVPARDVDDLAQDVYVEYYRNMDKQPEETTRVAWLKGIARNLSMSYFRRNKRRGDRFREVVAEALSKQSWEPLRSTGSIEWALETCLENLSEEHRQLVRLRYEGDVDGQELADRFDRTTDAIYVQLHRIRVALKDCIEQKVAEASA